MEITIITQGQTASGARTAAPAASHQFDGFDVATDAHDLEIVVRRLELVQRTQAMEQERLSSVATERHEILEAWNYLAKLNVGLLVELEALPARIRPRSRITALTIDRYRAQQDASKPAT